MNQPANRLPPTIGSKPGSGKRFEVLITTVWPIGEKNKVPDEASIRAEVAAAAKDASSQSVQGELPLREIKGTDGRGFYFVATDKAPKRGEYKYLTQGIIRVGERSLAFTVLTNHGQEAVAAAALELLRTAVHRTGGCKRVKNGRGVLQIDLAASPPRGWAGSRMQTPIDYEPLIVVCSTHALYS